MGDVTPTAGELAARLRTTWPKCDSFGPVTTAQRQLIHDAADLIDRLTALTPTQDGPSAEVVAAGFEAAVNAIRSWSGGFYSEDMRGVLGAVATDLELNRDSIIAAMPPTASTVNKAMLEALERAAKNFDVLSASMDDDMGTLRAYAERGASFAREAIALAKTGDA